MYCNSRCIDKREYGLSCIVSLIRARSKSGGIKDKFGKSEKFVVNHIQPKLVHSLSFSTKHLEQTFNVYKNLFKVFSYFRVNITQTKAVSHLVYELQDKRLVKTEAYVEFKESLNTVLFKELEFN